jgi:hypothetical protein
LKSRFISVFPHSENLNSRFLSVLIQKQQARICTPHYSETWTTGSYLYSTTGTRTVWSETGTLGSNCIILLHIQKLEQQVRICAPPLWNLNNRFVSVMSHTGIQKLIPYNRFGFVQVPVPTRQSETNMYSHFSCSVFLCEEGNQALRCGSESSQTSRRHPCLCHIFFFFFF